MTVEQAQEALSFARMAEIVSGRVVAGDASLLWTGGLSTDTRTIGEGDLFIALRGESFDGNVYAAQAAREGASAVIVSDEGVVDEVSSSGALCILVEDTLEALQILAAHHRGLYDVHPVVITGSNGKTTTKDFVKAIFEQREPCSATVGNLNNHIGLPLTVLGLKKEHKQAVWEIGMNHPGELEPLCMIAHPHIGIITCIGTAHVEFMGSREGIAEEKATLARALPESGYLILPAQDDFTPYIVGQTKAQVVLTGGETSKVRAQNIERTEDGSRFTLVVDGDGEIEVTIHVPGEHMVGNALLAAGAAHCAGFSLNEISSGLESCRPTKGRLTRKLLKGCIVLDDTYNANPDSMKAALKTLAEIEPIEGGRRIAVLGNMGELGSYAVEGYRSVGALIGELTVDCLVTIGDGAVHIAHTARELGMSEVKSFATNTGAASWLRDRAKAGDVLLFKGSRSAHIEEVLNEVFSEIIND